MKTEVMEKFFMTLGEITFARLEKEAKKREITVQELIRAVIIPEWLNKI